MHFGKKKIPRLFIIITVAYLLYALAFTPNFWLTIPVILFPLLAFRLFWIDNQPNVIFWGMMLQWISSAIQLLYANYLGVTLQERMIEYTFPAHMMASATLLSTLGLYAFSIGIFLAIRTIRPMPIGASADEYSAQKIFVAYVVVSLVIFLTSSLIWAFPGFVQYLYSLFYVKWGIFLVAFYVVHKRAAQLKWYFYGLIVLEFFLGLNSFFAREILYVSIFTIIGIILLQPRLTWYAYTVLAIGIVLIAHYLILWSAIKREYREFVSQGQRTQSVLVSPEQARDKFMDLMTNVDEKKYQIGMEEFINRLGYIQFFAACLEHVPEKVPHQNGDVYLSAVQHYLVPRFINPNKEVLDDSKHTSKYTGLRLSGAKEASSFSLGYIADAYVDFGRILMFPLLIAFGWLFGAAYRFIVKRCPDQVWVLIFTTPFIILLNINGADTKKALGGLLIYFLTIALVQKPLTNALNPFIRGLK